MSGREGAVARNRGTSTAGRTAREGGGAVGVEDGEAHRVLQVNRLQRSYSAWLRYNLRRRRHRPHRWVSSCTMLLEAVG